MLEIYVDGSCLNNGLLKNEGGFGVIAIEDGKLIHAYQKRNVNTTNNKEEVRAVLYAFFVFGSKENIPTVYSDSSYVVQTFNKWMFDWAKNGWVKADGHKPKNLFLIKEYYKWYQKGFRINLKKIKGHVGIEYNELADKLATNKIKVENLIQN